MKTGRRHFKHSDDVNRIFDELMGARIPAARYVDALVSEADAQWRGAVATLRLWGFTVAQYEAAMTALGNVDGTESRGVIDQRLEHCSAYRSFGLTDEQWSHCRGLAKAHIEVMRALLALSRARARGLSPIIQNAMGAHNGQ